MVKVISSIIVAVCEWLRRSYEEDLDYRKDCDPGSDMKLKILSNNNFKDIGSVYLDKDNNVVWNMKPEDVDAFSKVFYGDRTYTPADGMNFIIYLFKWLKRSSTVPVHLEDRDDVWYSKI